MEKTCQHIQELMPQLMEGTLSGEQTAEAQSHITQCRVCSRYLQALESDDKLLSDFAVATQATIVRLEDKVTDVLNRSRPQKPLRSGSVWATISKRPIGRLAAAAVIIIAAIAGTPLFRTSVKLESVAFGDVGGSLFAGNAAALVSEHTA
ncbi:MAG: anti-sigma factor family protein, partial [Planctomycetota bacterium]